MPSGSLRATEEARIGKTKVRPEGKSEDLTNRPNPGNQNIGVKQRSNLSRTYNRRMSIVGDHLVAAPTNTAPKIGTAFVGSPQVRSPISNALQTNGPAGQAAQRDCLSRLAPPQRDGRTAVWVVRRAQTIAVAV